jgi:hypothetical protein
MAPSGSSSCVRHVHVRLCRRYSSACTAYVIVTSAGCGLRGGCADR